MDGHCYRHWHKHTKNRKCIVFSLFFCFEFCFSYDWIHGLLDDLKPLSINDTPVMLSRKDNKDFLGLCGYFIFESKWSMPSFRPHKTRPAWYHRFPSLSLRRFYTYLSALLAITKMKTIIGWPQKGTRISTYHRIRHGNANSNRWCGG